MCFPHAVMVWMEVSVRPLSLVDVWGNAAPEEPISISFLELTLWGP